MKRKRIHLGKIRSAETLLQLLFEGWFYKVFQGHAGVKRRCEGECLGGYGSLSVPLSLLSAVFTYKTWFDPTFWSRGVVSKSEGVGGAQNEWEVQKGVSFLLRPPTYLV